MRDWIEVFMRRSMHNFITYAKEQSLSMSQINALFHIHRIKSCSVSEISEHLGITNAASSQMLDRLVQQKIIIRTEDQNDRRNKIIQLTDLGHEMVIETMHARQRWLADLESLLDEKEKEQVITTLKMLTEKAKQLHDPCEPNC
jgi:DNA-binding MarR family transcriptional regulator